MKLALTSLYLGAHQERETSAYIDGTPDQEVNDMETLVQDGQCHFLAGFPRSVGAGSEDVVQACRQRGQ